MGMEEVIMEDAWTTASSLGSSVGTDVKRQGAV